MKTSLLSSIMLALAAAAGCQSSSVASSQRDIDVAGAQSRYTVAVNENTAPAGKAEPFALQGWSNEAPAQTPVPTAGFQAR